MDPVALLVQGGLLLVFASVLLEQAGLPIPAPPILIGAGALAVEGAMHPAAVLAAGLCACLLADHAWFSAGKRHPGVSAESIPTAASIGVPYARFVSFDAIGSLLWVGAYVAAGAIFHREVHRVLDILGQVGGRSLLVLGALFYLRFKLARRHQLRRLFEVRRIDPDEMEALRAVVTFCTCARRPSPASHASPGGSVGKCRVRMRRRTETWCRQARRRTSSGIPGCSGTCARVTGPSSRAEGGMTTCGAFATGDGRPPPTC